jgi:transposase
MQGGSSLNGGHSGQCPAWKQCAGDLPLALEAVKRIDALFDIERNINRLSAEKRGVRQERSAPILAALGAWLHEERPRLSRSASVA